MSDQTSAVPPVKNLTLLLRALVLVAAAVSMVETVYIFFSDFPLALPIDGEVWTKPVSELTVHDRFVLFAFIEIATLFWFSVLYQFWRLCGLYAQGLFFTALNARCFKYIAWAIIGMSLVDSVEVYAIGAYLTAQGIIPMMPDVEFFLLLETDFLVAGLFFLLIAKIMERAAVMQGESELTI